jgi:hypothetical protein
MSTFILYCQRLLVLDREKPSEKPQNHPPPYSPTGSGANFKSLCFNQTFIRFLRSIFIFGIKKNNREIGAIYRSGR